QIANFGFGRRAFSNDFQIGSGDNTHVAILYQQTTIDTFVIQTADALSTPFTTGQYTHVLFGFGYFQCFWRNAWSDNHFNKLTGHNRFCSFCIQLTVESNDAAESRFGISRVSQFVGFENVSCNTNAAWVSVFNNYARGLVE